MGFVDNLRMNGMFPTSIAPPTMPSDISSLFGPLMAKRDYERQQERDWMIQDENRRAHLAQIAEGMKKPNVVMGISPLDQAKLDQKNRDLDIKQSLGDRRLDIQDENYDTRNSIADRRADTYDFKAHNPGQRPIAVPGGNYMSFDPISGTMTNTGTPSGRMTDSDKIDANFSNALSAIRARGDVQQTLQDDRQEGNLADIAARMQGKTPPAPKALSPTQENTKYNNDARQFKIANPTLGRHITFDEKGNVVITPPGTRNGPTQEEYDQITSGIKGSTAPKKSGKNNDPLGIR